MSYFSDFFPLVSCLGLFAVYRLGLTCGLTGLARSEANCALVKASECHRDHFNDTPHVT